jgi:hypothetical protein
MLTGRRLTGRSGITMPDEHGLLSKADNDSIQRWWGQHWKDPVICPVCKTTDWSLTSHLVNVQRFATDANASNAPTYPHIIVTCKFCAHSMFFNAVQIGIAAPPARQPTAGAAASDFVAKVNEMGQGGIVGLTRSLTDLVKKQD